MPILISLDSHVNSIEKDFFTTKLTIIQSFKNINEHFYNAELNHSIPI